ncbi:MAG: DUF3459 domain-containing protein [Lentisphaerae bacterium]|nr:DUF3459 domain-containing protein [Lentisphaerota bacterium]
MREWIADAVIYQVNLRSFAAREPRNPIEASLEADIVTSPLAFLTEHLGYIRELGATVVYLMPPFAMGLEGRKGIGSPYSIRDFCAIDPEHGSMEVFVAMVKQAHALGLRVILDLTPNHTSRDNVWVGIEGVHCRNADGTLYHDFDWSDTAKLDYTNPRTRHEMGNVLSFWLDICEGDGVDGFRFDMAHMLNDLSFWDETLPALRTRHSDRDLLFLAECYGVERNRDLFARGMNAAYDDDFYKVCQYGYARDDHGNSQVCLSKDAFGNADFSDKAEAFVAGGIAAAFSRALLAYEDGPSGATGPWLARYTDNHDEGRGCFRFGDGAVRAVSQLIFLSGHCLPFLLCGQEYGALNRPSIHDRLKGCDKGYRVCGEGCEQSGSVDGVEFEGNLFARSSASRAEWQTFFRDLIRLRHEQPSLRRGTMKLLDVGEEAAPNQRTVVAFERTLGDVTLCCAVNMGAYARTLTNLAPFAGEVLHGQLDDGRLGPFAAFVTEVG